MKKRANNLIFFFGFAQLPTIARGAVSGIAVDWTDNGISLVLLPF
jgi:hypothetical protein